MCRMLSIFQCYGGNYQHVELSSKPLNYTFLDSLGDIIAIISNSYWVGAGKFWTNFGQILKLKVT